MDPRIASTPLSYQKTVQLDELEAHPDEGFEFLQRTGAHLFYIPRSHGGRLSNFEELLNVVRIGARRDLTATISHGKTLLGAISVWMAGSEDQKQKLSRLIASGGKIALALTERSHGSDFRATETKAEPCPEGYLLSGEKWLVNNATRSDAMTVLAREANADGQDRLSLFLVLKDELDEGSFCHLPKIKTHGVRGMDVSGIRFDSCTIPRSARVGSRGQGLSILLKGMQVTRIMAIGLSLGSVDTALRVTLSFARERKLYGSPILEISTVRHLLVECFVDLLACECLAATAARGLHVIPRQMSILSSVAKYWIPKKAEEIVGRLATVLGARHYLREEPESGIFQKILRDLPLIGLFDGNAAVNLNWLSSQLFAQLATSTSRDQPARWNSLFSLDAPLPALDLTRLRCASPDGGPLGAWIEACRDCPSAGNDSQGRVWHHLEQDFQKTKNDLERLLGTGRAQARRSTHAFDAAIATSRHYAIASAILTWKHNRNLLGRFFREGDWLMLLALRHLNRQTQPHCCELVGRIVPRLNQLLDENRLFSIYPISLAGQADARYSVDQA